MTNRRTFLRSAIGTALGAGLYAASGSNIADADETPAPGGKSGKLNLTFRPYLLTLRHAFGVAGVTRTTTQSVQVEIEYEGVVGYGEASMPPYLSESTESVLAFLARVDLSQFSSPFEIDDILTYVDGICENNAAAKASIDIALHDLVGKLIGQPWWKIWGLNKEKTPSTFYTIGIDAPDVVREKTKEALKFDILKVKLGRDKKSDREMIEAVRDVTDKPIAIDANQGWKDKVYALEMVEWLYERGIILIEQPMKKTKLDDIAWITERSPLPVIADESLQRLTDIPRLKGAFSGINIKLMKCTGMREAWKMLNLARALDMKVMVGCMTESSCAISAAAQLSPMVDWADLDGNLLVSNDIFDGVKTAPNGKLILSDKPGLGLTKLDAPINRLDTLL
ncbi:MAG: dipeptide epimerase [Thermoguttaceae bacterium]|nr:dipeptide epimerase [Thermoguttaceae bacterium]MBQ2556632.1 dipeptide epimerase [Thermoguttaceae bacterium]MBQ3821814.1 dipeptide epimerase [Thermoguttaceae bacterium]